MPDDSLVEPIRVNPAGGRLSARMLAGHASPGHYSLMLLENDRTTIVKDWGNRKFSTPAANTHELPGSASENIGRFLFALTSVGIVDQNGLYAVIMTVLQDGKPKGTASDSGTATTPTKESRLIALLEEEEALNGVLAAVSAADRRAHNLEVKSRLTEVKSATRKAITKKPARSTKTAKRKKGDK